MAVKWPKRIFPWEEPMSDYARRARMADKTDKEPKIHVSVHIRVTATERALRFDFSKPDQTELWGF